MAECRHWRKWQRWLQIAVAALLWTVVAAWWLAQPMWIVVAEILDWPLIQDSGATWGLVQFSDAYCRPVS